MTSDNPTVAFASALRRFQSRLRLGAFLRYLPVTSAIVLGALDVGVLAGRQDGVTLVASAGSIVLAIVTAYGLAILQVPSRSAAARIVDRELRLQDRAISALACSSTMDAIARLVVADAAARLQAVPVSRLPLAVPASALWLAAATVAVSAVILVPLARTTSDFSLLSDASPATSIGRAAGNAARRTHTSTAPGRTAGTGKTLADGRDPATASFARASVPAGQSTNAERRSAEAAASRGNSTPSGRDATDSTREPLTSPPPSGSSAFPGFGASSGGGRARGNAARGSSSSLSAPGRGASAPALDRSAGGGARGGALVSGESRDTNSRWPPLTDRRPPAPSAARARAESAPPMERVPASHRSYVRAYFLAIRAGQWR